MKSKLGKIHQGDCIEGMNALPAGSVDLAFADPPFNIGYKYDVYEDRMAAEDYLKWSRNWMSAVHRVLKPDGTFWLAIGDDFAAELKIEAQKIGFHCRSWVIWYYTFGVNCKNKFTRSHTHLFYFVKDREKFTFREADLKNRVPSARALVYADKRAKGNGRLPDDTWIIPPVKDHEIDHWEASSQQSTETFLLRPQEASLGFRPEEDTWYIPRVAGTFKERAGFHGCQMPEQLLGRIIRLCSEVDEVVMDPFSGSASTLVAAKKLGRKPLGFELSNEYTNDGMARLDATSQGDRLDGASEPTMEAFTIAATEQQAAGKPKRNQTSADFAELAEQQVDEKDIENLVAKQRVVKKDVKNLVAKRVIDLENGLIEAFSASHAGFSTDVLLADPNLNNHFVDECSRRGLPGDARIWNHSLLRIRKRTGGSQLQAHRRFSIPFTECEPFLFASEAAWKTLIEGGKAKSLDEIFCDPDLAECFDEIARQFAPGFEPVEYRWGALRIRKYAKVARRRAEILKGVEGRRRLSKKYSLDEMKKIIPESAGVYLISEGTRRLYVGAALMARKRLAFILSHTRRKLWSPRNSELRVQYYQTNASQQELMAWSSYFLSQHTLPKYNVEDLRTAT